MSTRFSNACSRRPRRSFRRLICAGAVALVWPTAAAIAQEEPPGAPRAAVDPVTRAVQGDPLTQLRISAISFQDPKHLGKALSGVIGAFLQRGRLREAMVDLSVIKDPVWRAHALLHFAAYHRDHDEAGTARDMVRRAERMARSAAGRAEKADILGRVSTRYAEYGDFGSARRVAQSIPSPALRLRQFAGIAELQARGPDRKRAPGAAESLRLAFETAKKGTFGAGERLSALLSIADTAVSLGFRKLAQEALEFGYGILAASRFKGSSATVATLTAEMVRVGARGRAMEIVRSLDNDIRHSYVLASVARAFADANSIEGAVPLFYLARQNADTIADGPVKSKLLTHIVAEQTRALRLADAFTTAGKIKPEKAQRKALFDMADILLERRRPLEALKLVDYLPDMGMRAQIFSSAARHYHRLGDGKRASELLLRSIQPTGTSADPKTLAVGAPMIFEALADMPKLPRRGDIFAGARRLLEAFPNTPAKVPVMTRVAAAEMRDGQKDAAERSLGMAWRIAWLNKEKDSFPQLLTDIAMAQLQTGELLLAFDTAARISEDSAVDVEELMGGLDVKSSSKAAALRSIAVAAARQSESQLALRAARTIADPDARAGTYREIALALPTEKNLQPAPSAPADPKPDRSFIAEQPQPRAPTAPANRGN